MKAFFESVVADRMDMKMFFGEMSWVDTTVNFKSGMGEGFIAFKDNEAAVHIELTMFGSAMQNQVESVLEKFPEMFANAAK